MKQNKLSIPIYKGVYYKSCYYNLLLCILLYFKKDPSIFFDNDLFYYSSKINAEERGLLFSYINLMNFDESHIIEMEGLKPVEINFQKIKYVIDSGFPIFTRISRKYWNSQKNLSILRNLDLAHNYIIYGYDDDSKKFNALDSTPDGIIDTQIECKNILLGIKDYARFHKRPALQFYKLANKDSMTNTVDLKTNYRQNRNLITRGIESILTAEKNYKKLSMNKWQDMSFPNILIDINKIIMYRKFEFARNKKYVKDQKYELYSNQAIETLYILQGLFTKINIRGVANEAIKNSICSCLIKLYKLESSCNALFQKNLFLKSD